MIGAFQVSMSFEQSIPFGFFLDSILLSGGLILILLSNFAVNRRQLRPSRRSWWCSRARQRQWRWWWNNHIGIVSAFVTQARLDGWEIFHVRECGIACIDRRGKRWLTDPVSDFHLTSCQWIGEEFCKEIGLGRLNGMNLSPSTWILFWIDDVFKIQLRKEVFLMLTKIIIAIVH